MRRRLTIIALVAGLAGYIGGWWRGWRTGVDDADVWLDLAELRRVEEVEQLLRQSGGRVCANCRCTDSQACEGGCYWVADDLCSTCMQDLEAIEGESSDTE